MKNQEISEMFERIAEALELKGENLFRINAYRKAARILQEFPGDLEHLKQEGRLQEIPGIGQAMAEKIAEYLETGRMAKYQEVLSGIPDELLELMQVPGLGPKTVSLANSRLGVKNLADLKRVIENGALAKLPGLGEKKVINIKKGIALFEQGGERIPLGQAVPIEEEIVQFLQPVVASVSPAGSLRRRKETIGDIDILATGRSPIKIVERFVRLPSLQDILAQGDTKASIRVGSHQLQVDLRVVKPEQYGAALQYFTGSKAHNVKLRGLAKDINLKISEYGVFRGNKKIAGATEEEVYQVLNLPWIPPELREDRGEIEAARTGTLPVLVEGKDIQGDFHVHSKYSDGVDDIETIAQAARKMGYSYIGIADHSKSARYAGGLTEDDLKRQHEEIDRLQERMKDIKILKGAEVDILADGKLDYPDKILEKLDFVIAAIHQGFTKAVTERMKKAMENPLVHIISHPTGRLLSQREGYLVDIEEVMACAAERKVALEINAYPDRLDLNDVNVMKAHKLGVYLVIGTDAHAAGMLKYMDLGVSVARRGWLEKEDLLNTYDWEKVPLRRRR